MLGSPGCRADSNTWTSACQHTGSLTTAHLNDSLCVAYSERCALNQDGGGLQVENESNRCKTVTLKVADGRPEDAGRGIARVSPQDMDGLGASVGDMVSVTGKRTTVAKVMRTYVKDRGQGLIQMDNILRTNALVAVNDSVTLQKVEAHPAKTLTLEPAGSKRFAPNGNETEEIRGKLEGMTVVIGDKVRVDSSDFSHSDFTVSSSTPEGPVTIRNDTELAIASGNGLRKQGKGVCFADIGGLNLEIQQIKEVVELPLKYPEVFERLGIEAPRGVLLQGPPGCGKTLIARAVANETSAYFTSISGPEVYHKYYGDSEAHLREIFQDATDHAPSIIFLDEIDSIAPKREDVYGEMEKRVVAQLMALMDGLQSRGQVVVIAATNIPDALDPALRRAGRFDREIAIGVPDKGGRLQIFNVHTKDMPLAPDVDLGELAEIAHGYVGADIEALCREAAMLTLRQALPEIDFHQEHIPLNQLRRLQVDRGKFFEALKDVRPSAVREVYTQVADVKWDDVGGLEEVKERLKETIEWPLKHARLFEYAKATPAKGVLLYGPSGTGKTLLAKAVANESGTNFISIKGPALLSKWVGESEKAVRDVFHKARMSAPCILFFDEIDALATTRGGSSTDSGVGERVVSQILTEMDGIEELKGVVVLAATNRLDMVDPALLSPGRFEVVIELPLPDRDTRMGIFKIHTAGRPLAKDADLETLADLTDGLSGGDIASICRRAVMLAIREFIESKKTQKDYPKFKIAARHFRRAMEEVVRTARATALRQAAATAEPAQVTEAKPPEAASGGARNVAETAPKQG
ncbi:MAG: CDC48 family AAA ATPase [Chloroflexi bacterium]|nr:CDC48 family AAA ATPase [Chloroflexota bacterium]